MTTLTLFVSHCPLEWQWLLIPWFVYQTGLSFFNDPLPLLLQIVLFDKLLKYISRYIPSHLTRKYTHFK